MIDICVTKWFEHPVCNAEAWVRVPYLMGVVVSMGVPNRLHKAQEINKKGSEVSLLMLLFSYKYHNTR